MATVNSDILRLVSVGAKTNFDQAYQAQEKELNYPKVATVVPVTVPTQDYAWLNSNPKMREFVDERVPESLKQQTWSLTDKEWEATLEVKRTTVEDEQYGLISLRARQLGQEAARHKEEIVFSQLGLAATTLGPDGQYLIDTDHNESGSNQSNKSTNALSEAELTSAIAAMKLFKDDKGKPMGIRPRLLVVGPKLEFLARKLLESSTNVVTQSLSAGGPSMIGDKNVLQGMLQLVVSEYLDGTYDDYWFLVDNSRPVGPVILQERSDVPIEWTGITDPESETVFLRGKYLYGIRARYVVGNGLWQTVYGGIL